MIGNVLLLRGDIKIKPYDRSSVTYDFLVELLGDYLLKSIPQGEVEVLYFTLIFYIVPIYIYYY
jgi:hypothetical protein